MLPLSFLLHFRLGDLDKITVARCLTTHFVGCAHVYRVSEYNFAWHGPAGGVKICRHAVCRNERWEVCPLLLVLTVLCFVQCVSCCHTLPQFSFLKLRHFRTCRAHKAARFVGISFSLYRVAICTSCLHVMGA